MSTMPPQDLAQRTTPCGWLALRLYPRRYLLVMLYGVALATVICLFMIDDLISFSASWDAVVAASVVFIALQCAFLTGAPHWRWPRPTGRRPMWVSLAVGSLLAGFLTLGLAGTLGSLLRIQGPVERTLETLQRGQRMNGFWAFGLCLVVPWGGWLVVFLCLWAIQPAVLFRRVYRLLIAGSLLELLITIPVDVQVRKRTSCYCNEGSFLGLIVGITMAAWAFGPGLVLLFLTRRLQRRRELPICMRCGYDLHGLESRRCPECGEAF